MLFRQTRNPDLARPGGRRGSVLQPARVIGWIPSDATVQYSVQYSRREPTIPSPWKRGQPFQSVGKPWWGVRGRGRLGGLASEGSRDVACELDWTRAPK